MYEELKARIVRCYEAIKSAPSDHNRKILNAHAKELFDKAGEIYQNGKFIKVR